MKNYSLVFVLILISCSKPKAIENDFDNWEKYNILWIVADDLGKDLGCFGNDLVNTPNLDKLASESILYNNLFTTAAVCSASRSGLITGMYPVSIEAHQHRTRYKKRLPDSIKTLPYFFKKAGYFVTNGNAKFNAKKGKTDYNFHIDFNELYQDLYWTSRAKNQKFFSQIQIFYPHRPFYKDSVNPINPNNINLPPYYPDEALIKKDWALYLETVQQVDISVGNIIKKLEEENLLDNTIIFFFGDQGRPHLRAKQFLYDGGINTPLMIRYPNGYKAGETSNKLISNIDIPVATLNLAGIEVPKYIQGKNFLSDDFERDYVFAMRDRRDETVDRIRAVRTKKFKYIKNYYPNKAYTQYNTYKEMHYPALPLMHQLYKEGKLNHIQSQFMAKSRAEHELYDLEKDPFEIHNLAENKTYQDTLSVLQKKLYNWVDKNDLGTYPESEEEIKTAQKEANKRRKKILNSRNLEEDASHNDLIKFWNKKLLP